MESATTARNANIASSVSAAHTSDILVAVHGNASEYGCYISRRDGPNSNTNVKPCERSHDPDVEEP